MDYGPVVFPSHIEEVFHVKIVCLIYVFLHITSRHRRSIFFTGSHKVRGTRPLVFPLRRVTFPNRVVSELLVLELRFFDNFGLLFACVKDGKYEQDDKLEWC